MQLLALGPNGGTATWTLCLNGGNTIISLGPNGGTATSALCPNGGNAIISSGPKWRACNFQLRLWQSAWPLIDRNLSLSCISTGLVLLYFFCFLSPGLYPLPLPIGTGRLSCLSVTNGHKIHLLITTFNTDTQAWKALLAFCNFSYKKSPALKADIRSFSWKSLLQSPHCIDLFFCQLLVKIDLSKILTVKSLSY